MGRRCVVTVAPATTLVSIFACTHPAKTAHEQIFTPLIQAVPPREPGTDPLRPRPARELRVDVVLVEGCCRRSWILFIGNKYAVSKWICPTVSTQLLP